ncbi:uncharacterized protein LOC126676961 [Mercurialis annua]|uniref:uncharacterized protein LOC126676961 n=1 Tax=Mercurialis annua TaxID=3986 RepID=UPI00215E8A15|nr:uncharacterized protein LOC126676961 [Mercurialis annua]
MALASHGFSIREFSSKKRAVDLEKCWPFSGCGGGGDDLPPITVKKFRWWSHELNKIKITNQKEQEQEEAEDQDYGISRNDEEAKDNNNNTGQRDEKKKKINIPLKSFKSKSKSPKKRSILEIFAVSPQVHKVDDDDDEQDEEESQDEKAKKKIKKKRIKIKNDKNKKKIAILNNSTVDKKLNKFKKKKKQKNLINNNKRSIANKGKSQKLMLPIPENSSTKVNGSCCKKKITKTILNNDGSLRRNKSGLKGSIQKKHGVQASKSNAKHHKKSYIPVRGILKNHETTFSQKNPHEDCNMSGGSQAMCCEPQYPDRHVRFSDKDDILGQRNKNSNSFEKNVFDSYRESLSSQSEHSHSTESDKESDAVGMDGMAAVSFSTGNGIGLQANNNKQQLPCINNFAGMPDFPRPQRENEQHFLDKSSLNPVIHGNNLHIYAHGYPTPPNMSAHAGISRLLPTVNEANNPPASPLCGNLSMTSNSRGKSIDYYEDGIHRFPSVDSFPTPKVFIQPESRNFPMIERTNRSMPFMPQSSVESITGQALQSQSNCHHSPVGLTGPTDWRQTVGVSGSRCINGEFYGLPLNSHGELIQVNSSGRVGSYPHNSINPGSFAEFATQEHRNKQAIPKGPLNLLPIQKNHNISLPAHFGVTEVPNSGALDVHLPTSERGSSKSVYPLDSNVSSLNNSLNQCREYFQNQNIPGIIMAQLKDNPGNLSTRTVQPTMRLMGKDVAVGRSNSDMQGFEDGSVWTDKEIIQEHRSSSNDLNYSIQLQLCSELDKSKETLHFPLEFDSNWASSQSNSQVKAQEARASHPCFNWKTSSAFKNGNLAGEQNATLHFHPSDLLYKESNLKDPFISGAENAGMSSQLPMPTLRNTDPNLGWRPADFHYQQNLPNVRQSAFEFPFLHPDCNEQIQSSSFLSSSKNLPPWLAHATIPVKMATMPSPNFSYPQNSAISSPFLRSSPGSPPLFVRPPVFPFSTEVHPNSSMNTSYNVPDHCKKSKKRPAAIAGGSSKASKMPSLMQELDPSDVWHNIRAYESSTCGSYEAEKNRFGASGPIRLTAGAKHIIKPGRNVDYDNPRLIHSTISFPGVTDSDSFIDSQKKSATIYRF